ncbi:thioredoxin family protein [Hymenobacter ginsengisoli]|uniref:Thioredoxin family protein n=1 Tax=Hymenobacter ginsengisoli TaxID=1051626 RepID=A0ABP8QGP8_9BACT|nr:MULTISPECIES: thioredoxin family protein [unclassified Hymenobacter]MBO2033194.1 thioredoxin family protein [Hymenobacter sp. BT559]
MSTPNAPVLTADRLAASLTYDGLRQHITEALATPQPDEHLAKQLPYYRECSERINQLTPTIHLLPELQTALASLTQRYVWAIITEGWCGDASHTVPLLEAVAQASGGHIETRYFLRNANTDLIDRYLTNGGRAMPIAVLLHADSLTEAAVWGPRPAPLQALMQDLKARQTDPKDITAQAHAWYDQDDTRTTQHELLSLVQKLS